MPRIDPPSLTDFLNISPVVLLSVWGLLVLFLDFAFLRKAESRVRSRLLGGVSLIGVVAAVAACFVPEFVETRTGSEELYFQGTLLGGVFVERVAAFVIVLLGFVILLSMSFEFTDYWGEYYALLFWSTVGTILLISAEELVTIFLSLETMTISLYLLTAFEKSRKRSAEGALKYFVYGSVSSALFLFGLSLIYGITGVTRLESIGLALRDNQAAIGLAGNITGTAAVLLVLVGFGFKVAAVPFHQWAPDAYEGAPAPVAAWIATGSKVASFIALLKMLVEALGAWASDPTGLTSPGWVTIVAIISAVTMTYGNFAALGQTNFKRLLAYSSIAHGGYMLVGVLASVVAQDGKAAGTVLFYLAVYGFSNIGAFALAAWMVRDKGTDEVEDLNGLASHSPGLAVCILLLMLSLIGMPVLAGFWGKLYMFMEAVNRGDEANRLTFLWLVALGLMNSVVSAFYYVRVLRAMFLRPSTTPPLARAPFTVSFPILASTAVVVGFGLYPAPLADQTLALADVSSFSIAAQKGFRSSVYTGPPIKDTLPNFRDAPMPRGVPVRPEAPVVPGPAAK
ncbi:MAG: NADH-quinone oxidoreductase subunit N [Isosphaeraceae bacterium]|nr:NADH-quinone oxidoreductase subunit N [Isosphaeraceae bacterium]